VQNGRSCAFPRQQAWRTVHVLRRHAAHEGTRAHQRFCRCCCSLKQLPRLAASGQMPGCLRCSARLASQAACCALPCQSCTDGLRLASGFVVAGAFAMFEARGCSRGEQLLSRKHTCLLAQHQCCLLAVTGCKARRCAGQQAIHCKGRLLLVSSFAYMDQCA